MFLIENVYAQSSAQGGSSLVSLLPLILLCVIFYFFLIRPQMRQSKEHKKMLNALMKGDEVVTNGGLLGRVKVLGDDFISLEVAKNIEIKVQRSAVLSVMPKGTLKQ